MQMYADADRRHVTSNGALTSDGVRAWAKRSFWRAIHESATRGAERRGDGAAGTAARHGAGAGEVDLGAVVQAFTGVPGAPGAVEASGVAARDVDRGRQRGGHGFDAVGALMARLKTAAADREANGGAGMRLQLAFGADAGSAPPPAGGGGSPRRPGPGRSADRNGGAAAGGHSEPGADPGRRARARARRGDRGRPRRGAARAGERDGRPVRQGGVPARQAAPCRTSLRGHHRDGQKDAGPDLGRRQGDLLVRVPVLAGVPGRGVAARALGPHSITANHLMGAGTFSARRSTPAPQIVPRRGGGAGRDMEPWRRS